MFSLIITWVRLITISTQAVEKLTGKIGMESLVLTETCPDTKFHCNGTTVIELRYFEKEKQNMDTMGILFFSYNYSIWCFLAEIMLSVHIFSA